jgi:hypothetical protein
MKTAFLLMKVECRKEIADLTDKAAGRIYTLDGCADVTARLLDPKDAMALEETLDLWEKARASNG